MLPSTHFLVRNRLLSFYWSITTTSHASIHGSSRPLQQRFNKSIITNRITSPSITSSLTKPMLTAAVCAGAAGFAWYSDRAKSSKTIAIDDHCNQSSSRLSKGSIHTDLEPIRQIFEDILKNEQQGLALAVYHNDELVVDLYGGYADRVSSQLWQENTMTVAFSATKVLGSLVIAILASRNLLNYDELVSKHWPAFAANGKQSITIQSIMDHTAGLIRFAREFDVEKANDAHFMEKLIEETKPMWPPGTALGYHATTFGWLVDQLVRKCDPNGRGIAQFYRDEIQPYMSDKDFYVGLPHELNERVAKVTNPIQYESLKDVLVTCIFKLQNLFRKQNLRSIALGYPKFMHVDDDQAFNRAQLFAVENVAALGIGTARGLASIPEVVMRKNMIREDIWQKISEPTQPTPVKDIVIDRQELRGNGFFYLKHPTRENSFLIAHGGHGGQMLVFDRQTKITIAILRNGLRKSVLAHPDTERIIHETFKLLDAEHKPLT